MGLRVQLRAGLEDRVKGAGGRVERQCDCSSAIKLLLFNHDVPLVSLTYLLPCSLPMGAQALWCPRAAWC